MAHWYKLSLPIKGIEAETRKAYLIKVTPDYNYLNYILGVKPNSDTYYFWISKKLVKALGNDSIVMIYTAGWNWNFAPKKDGKLDESHSINCDLKQLKQCILGACRV